MPACRHSATGRTSAERLGASFPETAFGVYLHWPFCAAKCPYCDFNSHVRHAPVDEERFAKAFAQELAHFADLAPGRTVSSVFLGGGTPSLMRPGTVGAVLDAVARYWSLASDVEITMEANPSSVEAERFRGYRGAGVNRVSLGVQALDDSALRALGRLHDVKTALAAVELARNTFPHVSFDLIHSRPGQTVDAWVSELGAALRMAADHLSVYQLTIEPGTAYAARRAAGQLCLPDEETLAAIHEQTQMLCADAGLPAYEISNHARPGAECRHNMTYWRYQDYVGCGPGAHGRITYGGDKHAMQCESLPEAWLKRVEACGNGLVEDVALTPGQCGDEMLVMGMRLVEGLSLDRYTAVSGRQVDPDQIALLEECGLVRVATDHTIQATVDGRRVLDSVIAALAT